MGRTPARRFFDLWATVYDLPLVQRTVYRPLQDAVMGELARAPVARVLDLACGTGILTRRLRRASPAPLVCGCDFSIGMLRRAATRGCSCLVQADVGRLPFADGSWDAVVSTDAFHWFPDPDAVLAEVHRVLADQGRLLLGGATVRAPAVGGVVELASRALGEPTRWPTRSELRGRLQAAGYRHIRQVTVRRVGATLAPTVLTVAVRPG